MDYYFQHEEAPDFGFSPDAEFPIINGEKGNVTIRLTFRGGNGADYKLESFKSGLRENMVPGTADAVVTAASADEAASLAASFETFIKQEAKISGNAELSDKTVTFHVVGKGAHGASPQSGINAATFLATFLNDYSFAEGAYSFINTIAEFIHEDFYGEKLGVAFEDEKMGKLTMNAGIVNFDPENPENSLVTLNFRYQKELQQKNYKQKFKQQSVKRSLQHKEIATKNRIMYQLMIHWWQRYYKFTKTIQAKKAKNKSLVAVLMAAY